MALKILNGVIMIQVTTNLNRSSNGSIKGIIDCQNFFKKKSVLFHVGAAI